MNGFKLFAGAVVASSVAFVGLVQAQSTGAGASPSGGMPRTEMGQGTNPGATTPTDPSTSQTNPRGFSNPDTDSTRQRLDNTSPSSRSSGMSSSDTGTGVTSGRDTMSDSNAPLRVRQAKADRN